MKYILIISILGMLQACVAAPEKTPGKELVKPVGPTHNGSSTESIKQLEEQKYARLLSELQGKNAQQDAQRAIGRGDLHVLGYQSGRGGLKIPGINIQQNRCRVQQLDGMGDVIFGENHLRYRVALRQYANQFNHAISSYCQ